jgi:hypothetical protein
MQKGRKAITPKQPVVPLLRKFPKCATDIPSPHSHSIPGQKEKRCQPPANQIHEEKAHVCSPNPAQLLLSIYPGLTSASQASIKKGPNEKTLHEPCRKRNASNCKKYPEHDERYHETSTAHAANGSQANRETKANQRRKAMTGGIVIDIYPRKCANLKGTARKFVRWISKSTHGKYRSSEKLIDQGLVQGTVDIGISDL